MDNTLYRDYYRIPTSSGYFYFYREYLNRGYDNATGDNYYEYNDFIEFFTGIVATPSNNLLDLRVPNDKIIFKTIKEELTILNEYELEKELKYINIISYNYMHFYSSYKSNKYSFANKPNYQDKLPYYNTNFIIELTPPFSTAKEKFISPNYDYHKLSSSKFANEIKELIDKYGSYQEVANVMLERIEKQSIACMKRDKFINNQLNENAKENNAAEEYIKKLIYKKD